ncbi:MAG: GDP-mannose 4,6-dehydratase [Candidatus Falkowbacteria bacterium]|nr:GDP-mannose 4,6-dehydratase [Candidatus Falkowbacteria bacterium]
MKRAIFDKKNVLVIGGAGFLGSHLCDELVQSAKVICIDNFSSGEEKNIDNLLANPDFRFIRHDMSEPIDLEKFAELQEFKIEFQGLQEIYNMACPTSPIHFEKNRIANLLANSYAVKNALDLAVKYKAKFMQFSSSVVYGSRSNDNSLVKEDNVGVVDMLSDRCSYDEGKRFAESMVKTYKDVYGIDAKIVRLFRAYGPRMPLDQGHMLPDFISDALDNKDLVIYGDESFSSSFCYISDCLDAVTKMMQSDSFGPINVGSDQDVNVSELANKIIKLTGSKSKVVYAEKMLFMTPLRLPDTGKARDLLGWMPLVTLEDGLAKTIRDLQANKGVKRIIGGYEV